MSLEVYCPECDIYINQEELVEGKCPYCDTPIEDEEPSEEEKK